MLANFSGRNGENRIAGILDSYGVKYKRQHKIGFTLFKSTRVDFYLTELHIYIEVKAQSVSGSVDEKWPYLVMNIRQNYDRATIIILLGDAHNQKAIEWVKGWVDGACLIGVFTEGQFKKWLRNEIDSVSKGKK